MNTEVEPEGDGRWATLRNDFKDVGCRLAPEEYRVVETIYDNEDEDFFNLAN